MQRADHSFCLSAMLAASDLHDPQAVSFAPIPSPALSDCLLRALQPKIFSTETQRRAILADTFLQVSPLFLPNLPGLGRAMRDLVCSSRELRAASPPGD